MYTIFCTASPRLFDNSVNLVTKYICHMIYHFWMWPFNCPISSPSTKPRTDQHSFMMLLSPCHPQYNLSYALPGLDLIFEHLLFLYREPVFTQENLCCMLYLFHMTYYLFFSVHQGVFCVFLNKVSVTVHKRMASDFYISQSIGIVCLILATKCSKPVINIYIFKYVLLIRTDSI